MPSTKYPKYSNIRIRYKLWMNSETGDAIIDDNTWALLIAIRNTGSLMSATGHCKISYRKAWGDVRKMQEMLGFEIVEKHRGGKTGGLSILTKEGEKLIDNYLDFREEFQQQVDNTIKKFKQNLKKN